MSRPRWRSERVLGVHRAAEAGPGYWDLYESSMVMTYRTGTPAFKAGR